MGRKKKCCDDCYIEVKRTNWHGVFLSVFLFVVLHTPILGPAVAVLAIKEFDEELNCFKKEKVWVKQ